MSSATQETGILRHREQHGAQLVVDAHRLEPGRAVQAAHQEGAVHALEARVLLEQAVAVHARVEEHQHILLLLEELHVAVRAALARYRSLRLSTRTLHSQQNIHIFASAPRTTK